MTRSQQDPVSSSGRAARGRETKTGNDATAVCDHRGVAARRFLPLLAALCLAALVLRVIILYDYVRHNPLAQHPIVDAEAYWLWAGKIASGHWVGDAPFFSAPLYPYLLGLLRALHGGLTTVYVLQLVLHMGTALLLAWIARARFGPGVGLTAVALFLMLVDPVTYTHRVLNCTLQLLVLCLCWMQIVRVQNHPTVRGWCLVGGLCGVLTLCYSPAMLLLFLLGPWIYAQSRALPRRVLAAVLPVGVGALVIAPAVLHNYWVSGELHTIQAAPSINLSQGYGPGAFGVYHPVPGLTTDRTHLFESAVWAFQETYHRPGTWREIDAYYRDLVLTYIREHPGEAALLAVKKLTLFLTARNYDDIIPPKFEAESDALNRFAPAPLPTPWLIGAALIGLVSLRRSCGRFAPEWAFFLLPLLVVLVFWYTPRYRFPAVPVICVTAALTIVRGLARLRSRRAWLPVIASAALAATGETVRALTGLDVIEPGRVQATAHLAGALERVGRRDEAIARLQQVCREHPRDMTGRLVLADVLARDGRVDQAIQMYEQVLRRNPDESHTHTNRGLLLIMRGRPQDLHAALKHFSTPASTARQAAKNHHGAGMALDKLGRLDEALVEYRRALEIDPANVRARCDLAGLLVRTGRQEEGIAHYRQAAKTQPAHPDTYYRWAQTLMQTRQGDKAVSIAREGLSQCPQETKLMGLLAWMLATADDPQVRNPPEAVRWAERAVRLEEDNPSLVEVLAVAHAANDRLDDAVAAIRKAQELAQSRGESSLIERLARRRATYENRRAAENPDAPLPPE